MIRLEQGDNRRHDVTMRVGNDTPGADRAGALPAAPETGSAAASRLKNNGSVRRITIGEGRFAAHRLPGCDGTAFVLQWLPTGRTATAIMQGNR